MPTYEYACSSCAHEWEAEQSIKEDPLKDCPSCQEPSAKRQISRGTGFILKGGGWYSDLYASSSNKSPSKSTESGSASGGEGGGSSAKSEGSSGSSGSSGDSGGSSGGSGSTSSGSSASAAA